MGAELGGYVVYIHTRARSDWDAEGGGVDCRWNEEGGESEERRWLSLTLPHCGLRQACFCLVCTVALAVWPTKRNKINVYIYLKLKKYFYIHN